MSLTINGHLKLSKDLALQSTIIKHMLEDCSGDLPENLDMPNVAKTITQDNIDALEKLKDDCSIWTFEIHGKHVTESNFQAAILLDMRRCISNMLYNSPKELFISHITKLDVLLACLENCGGKAFNILQCFLESHNLKLLSFAQYHIEKFIMYEKSTDQICYHFLIDSNISFTLESNKFGVVSYLKKSTALFTGGSLKNLLNEFISLNQQETRNMDEIEILKEMIHKRVLKLVPHKLYEIVRIGFIYMDFVFYVTKFSEHLFPIELENANIPDYLLVDPVEKYYELSLTSCSQSDICSGHVRRAHDEKTQDYYDYDDDGSIDDWSL